MAVDAGTIMTIGRTETGRFRSTDTESYLANPIWATATE